MSMKSPSSVHSATSSARSSTSFRESPAGRGQYSGHRPHQGGLSGPVRADDPHRAAVGDLEGDVLDRLDILDGALAAPEAYECLLEGGLAFEGGAVGDRK